MPDLTVDIENNLFEDTFVITKQSNTVLTLDTENTFVDKDIELTLNVQQGSVTVSPLTITAVPTMYNSTTNNNYLIKVDTTQNITPSVTINGFVTSNDMSAGAASVVGEIILSGSTLSTSSTLIANSVTSTQIVIGEGYYPNDRIITIQAMSEGEKANLSINGVISTTPVVSINGDCTMATTTTPTNYYFSRSGTITNGIVGIEYQNTVNGFLNAFSTTSKTVTVIPTISEDSIIYIPAATVTSNFSGGALSVSATYSNIELTETDISNNKIKITLNTNKETVSLINTVTEGYIAATNINVYQTSANTSKDYYIKGLTLQKPSSGTATFYLTFPNGDNDTMTFNFSIDTSGNVTIS